MGLLDRIMPFVPQAALELANRSGLSRETGAVLVVSSTVVLTAVLSRRLMQSLESSPSAQPSLGTSKTEARDSVTPDDAKAGDAKASDAGGSAGHTLADGTRVDFSGSWAKDDENSEDYSEFEAALGTPPTVKMMTAGLAQKKVIEHQGLAWTQHSIVGLYCMTKRSALDGTTVDEKHPFQPSVKVQVVCELLGDGTVQTTSTFEGLSTATKHVVRRTLVDDGQGFALDEVLTKPDGEELRWKGRYKKLENDAGTAGTIAPPCATQ